MKKVFISISVLIFTVALFYARTLPIDTTHCILPKPPDTLTTDLITYKEERPFMLNGKSLTIFDGSKYKIADAYGNVINYYEGIVLKSGFYIIFSTSKQFKLFVK